MIFSDRQIAEAVNDKRIEINPYNDSQLNPNSYDVRLGNWFVFVGLNIKTHLPVYRRIEWIPDGQQVLIGRGTVLGMSKEIVGTYAGVVATLRNKSTTSRMGISICNDGGFGDVGYINHWTATLSSNFIDQDKIGLEVGKPFAQIVFQDTKDNFASYKGQYNEVDFPLAMIPSRFREEHKPFFEYAVNYMGSHKLMRSHVMFYMGDLDSNDPFIMRVME